VQLTPAGNELAQVVPRDKSPTVVSVIAILLIVRVVVPTFLSVTVIAALVVPICEMDSRDPAQ